MIDQLYISCITQQSLDLFIECGIAIVNAKGARSVKLVTPHTPNPQDSLHSTKFLTVVL